MDTYHCNDNSRELPYEKNGQPQKVLEKSIRDMYKEFKLEHPEVNISEDKFRKLRPKNIKVSAWQKWQICLCEYCVNLELKLKSFNKFHVTSEKKMNSKFDVLNASLCEKPTGSRFHQIECINRSCKKCGVEILKRKLNSSCQNKAVPAKWQVWENVPSTSSEGKKVSKKVQVEKTGTLRELIEELCKEASTIARHLFEAKWQHTQLEQIREKLPNNWVILMMDFAENFRTCYQDEVAAAHWAYSQVTIHPMILYYHCQECNEVVKESLVCISDDLKHDSHAVHKFTQAVTKHIEVKAGKIDHMVQYSDGHAAQYKSKTPFMDISMSTDDFGFSIERSFFGSRHGKSLCDGLGGVVKTAVLKAVKLRQVTIRDASDMFAFCNAKLKQTYDGCHHSSPSRSFFYISTQSIQRDRTERTCGKTLTGTRQFLNIVPVSSGVVKTRALSCYCSDCLQGRYEQCQDAAFVPEFVTWHLMSGKKVQPVLGKPQKNTEVTGEKKTTKKSALVKEKRPPKTLTRKGYFKAIAESMGKCKSFAELQKLCSDSKDSISQWEIKGTSKNVRSACSKAYIDTFSQSLIPDDIPGNPELHARRIYGDGNCLARVGSVAAFGKEEDYLEVKARIIEELVSQENLYLDPAFLALGMKDDKMNSRLPERYAMYSEKFAGQKVKNSPEKVRQIYQSEVLEYTRLGEYAGIWQIHALASALKVNLFSTYPCAGYNVRPDLHRLIIPRDSKDTDTVYVLWTSATKQ